MSAFCSVFDSSTKSRVIARVGQLYQHMFRQCAGLLSPHEFLTVDRLQG